MGPPTASRRREWPAAAGREAGWRAAGAWLPAALLVLYTGVLVLCAADARWRPEWDSAIYVLSAQSLAADEGYHYLGEPIHRPPGLPLLLAAVQGTGPFHAAPLNRLIMLFAGLAAAACYAALRPLEGRALALAAALAAASAPLWVRSFNWIQSEFPFLALLFAACALLRGSARPGRAGVALGVAAGACLAGAFAMRTAALLLWPALAWAVLRRRGAERRAALVCLAVASLLVLPWVAYTLRAWSAPPSDQLLLAGYDTAIFRSHPGDPSAPAVGVAGWLARVRGHGGALLRDLGASVPGLPGAAGGAVLATVAVAGLALRARRRASVLDWFAASYALVVVTYFTYHWRLVVPLLPFVFFYALVAARAAGRRLGMLVGGTAAAGRAGPALALAAVAGFALAHALRLPEELDPWRRAGGRPTALAATRANLDAVGAWLRAHTAPDAVVLCNQAPSVRLLSGRLAYTYRFGAPEALLARYRPDVVVFDGAASPALREAVETRARERVLLPDRRGAGPLEVFLLGGDATPPPAALR